MSIPTVEVICTATGNDGEPVAGAVFTARLNRFEMFEGIVVPRSVTQATGEDGTCTLKLWPNVLGDRSATSYYLVSGKAPGELNFFMQEKAVVP
ncbi:MAG: hypothetical protein V4772_15595, partial [Pseudomonadota bacterium]